MPNIAALTNLRFVSQAQQIEDLSQICFTFWLSFPNTSNITKGDVRITNLKETDNKSSICLRFVRICQSEM
ncbi:MAG: hypothetical protein EOO34_00130 [Cyanobacteriota bacterium]|nr:MAG: hypothetical protein EOO34_00130 [Cyanobacteriota bacterium]